MKDTRRGSKSQAGQESVYTTSDELSGVALVKAVLEGGDRGGRAARTWPKHEAGPHGADDAKGASGADALRLEHQDNNRKSLGLSGYRGGVEGEGAGQVQTGPTGRGGQLSGEGDRLRLIERRCRARTCAACAPVYGGRVRSALHEMAARGEFGGLVMFTFTVDREGTVTGRGFASPRDAWEYVSKGGYVRRLMRDLGFPRWFWVLEIQEGSGDGWPHWHVLVDVGPGGRVKREQIKRAWAMWRDKWGIGGVDVQASKWRQGSEGVAHAINYATKYLTKPVEAWPPWLLEYEGRVRFVQGSRLLGAIVTRGAVAARRRRRDGELRAARERVAAASPGASRGDVERAARRSVGLPEVPEARASMSVLVDRMARCKQACVLVRERVDMETGEVRLDFVGDVPSSVDWCEIAGAGGSPGRRGAVGEDYGLGAEFLAAGRAWARTIRREWVSVERVNPGGGVWSGEVQRVTCAGGFDREQVRLLGVWLVAEFGAVLDHEWAERRAGFLGAWDRRHDGESGESVEDGEDWGEYGRECRGGMVA